LAKACVGAWRGAHRGEIHAISWASGAAAVSAGARGAHGAAWRAGRGARRVTDRAAGTQARCGRSVDAAEGASVCVCRERLWVRAQAGAAGGSARACEAHIACESGTCALRSSSVQRCGRGPAARQRAARDRTQERRR
jgi:hypothetical protein